MFKPKVYKSNGMEAYHLISGEGGSFLYEGRIEYSEAELFKDEHGKAYYLVTTDIGSPSKYYVEVEPLGKPIPAVQKGKAISDLLKTTPEDTGAEAAETHASPEPPAAPKPEAAPTAAPKPEAAPAPAAAPLLVNTSAPEAPKETCFETPEEPAEKPSTTEEAHAAVKAMASLGEHRPHKKSKLPLILALLLIVLVASGAAVAIYKPSLISGLPFINQATPTPTVMPTTAPTATPTATPVPTETTLPGGSDMYKNLLMIAPMINGSDPEVMNYSANNSNRTGTSFSKLGHVCDLFDTVYEKWSLANDNGTPQNVSESVQNMKGSMMDYSILMASLAEAEGMDSRVVAVYDDNIKTYIYYPEVKVAPNDSDYNDALMYLRGRYDIQNPYGHKDGVVHWLSLSLNKTPGGYVDTKFAYTVNSQKEITGV